jgi:hypothetical protein
LSASVLRDAVLVGATYAEELAVVNRIGVRIPPSPPL